MTKKYPSIAILLTTLVLFLTSETILAEETGLGLITFTEGHVGPACRTVAHLEDGTGTLRYFRIADAQNDNDISSIVLAALIAEKKVSIFYNPNETTGCGIEPKILFIRMHKG